MQLEFKRWIEGSKTTGNYDDTLDYAGGGSSDNGDLTDTKKAIYNSLMKRGEVDAAKDVFNKWSHPASDRDYEGDITGDADHIFGYDPAFLGPNAFTKPFTPRGSVHNQTTMVPSKISLAPNQSTMIPTPPKSKMNMFMQKLNASHTQR